jgi:lysozyme
MNIQRMEEQLLLHEGLRLTPYVDTVGKTTVGVGYNVTDRGVGALEQAIGRKVGTDIRLTHDEAMAALRADIVRVERAVRVAFPEYDWLDEVRQRVVCDMAFNLGYGALAFKQCIAAIRRRDWSAASRELWKSKWSTQVGDGPGGHYDRADRLTNMLLTGRDYLV